MVCKLFFEIACIRRQRRQGEKPIDLLVFYKLKKKLVFSQDLFFEGYFQNAPLIMAFLKGKKSQEKTLFERTTQPTKVFLPVADA